MSREVRVTCDHPGGCVRTLIVPWEAYQDVPLRRAGWYSQWETRDELVGVDLCPEHKYAKPT